IALATVPRDVQSSAPTRHVHVMVIRPSAAIGNLRDGLAAAEDLKTLHAHGRRQASIGERRIDKRLLGAFDDDRDVIHDHWAAAGKSAQGISPIASYVWPGVVLRLISRPLYET